MNPLAEFLAAYWCPALLLGIALAALAVLGLLRRRKVRGFKLLLILSIALAVASIGGLTLSPRWGWWLLVSAGTVFVCLFVILALSGAWRPALGWSAAVLAAFGAGGLWLNAAGANFLEICRDLRGLTFLQPWWLLLLLLVPLFFLLSAPRLNRSEPRPWVAVGLRSAGVICLSLALAEPQLRQPNDRVTVLFVVDRSKSIPEELADDPGGGKKDQRERRLRQFINNAVAQRGAGHERDRAGLIVFGRRPRLELPPSDAPRFNLKELPDTPDGDYTDIAAALKLALASFADDTGKRIVLISDGNENLGNAEEQARLAKTLGVEIDVLPLAAGQTNEDEVLVERVEAPPVIEQGARVPVRVLVRSHNPNLVVGRLILKQIIEGQKAPAEETKVVALRRGLNVVTFPRTLTDEQRSYSYEAEFLPERVEDEKGEILQRELPGDRVQNNRAAAHVVARGQRRILILEGKAGDHRFLAEKLREAGGAKFKIVAEPVALLDRYKDRDKLAVFLSNFDCVVLANVAADQVSEEQQEVLRDNTHEQGCGLVMIGGPDGFGAGGWQNTPVEKALPVDSEIKSLQVLGKGGLVLIMHASEMADGNLWQKKIAKLAVERLGPGDEVGVVYYDFAHKWHIPLQQIAGNKASILAKIDKMSPGDMPDFDPALRMAHQALTANPDLATKHVIVISDGDPQYNPAVLTGMKKDKVTVTTVGVACHGVNEDQKMLAIAKATGGRAYSVKDPRQLPAIYIKESRLVSQSFVHEKRFTPRVLFRSGPTDRLPDNVPPLGGFVRTTPKASPLVEISMQTPPFADQEFPLLAYWHFGLGKAVAFTSDAGEPKFWSRDWTQAGGAGRGGLYGKFWEQVIDWSLRPTESRRLNMTTEYRDGKIRIVVDARTDDNRPDVHLKLRGGITPPSRRGDEPSRQRELRFVQTNSGQYEAEVKADEAGSYFLSAQAVRMKKIKGRDGREHEIEEGVDSVRAGVTLPYSPEFAELASNTPLLERLRELTGGRSYIEDETLLADAAKSGAVFRPAPERVKSLLPLWYWLVFLAAVLLLSDVAVRRLAIEPERIAERARYVWARLRGLPVPEPMPAEVVDRLQMRRPPGAAPAQAGQRFEGGAILTGGVPAGADATSAPPPPPLSGARPAAPALGAAPPEPEAEDYASRLLKAKKKALEERKKDGERPA